MVTVRELLKGKGSEVWYVKPNEPVLKALTMMADKDIGSLLVMEEGKLRGIVTERDFVRSLSDSESCALDADVKKYMTRLVITVNPSPTDEDCMRLMTEHRICHLPVVDNDRAIGVLSIRDIVKAEILSRDTMNNSLENSIEGRGYGQQTLTEFDFVGLDYSLARGG